MRDSIYLGACNNNLLMSIYTAYLNTDWFCKGMRMGGTTAKGSRNILAGWELEDESVARGYLDTVEPLLTHNPL
jgi:hypothetical protein